MASENESVTFRGFRYEWLGQSTMRITAPSGLVIYTDPVMLDAGPPVADLILVTHHHVDHCLPEFITPIRGDATRVAAFHASYIQYCVHDIKGVRTVKIGQRVDLGGVTVTGVEAYTKRGFHSRGEGCGFIIGVEGQRIYFAGDTARIPEMEEAAGVDVAILPICDNTYTIDPADMAQAVKEIGPGLFIPVHFTPVHEPDPETKEGMLFSKDPRFFTRKEDPRGLVPLLEGTGIEVALLKKLGKGL
ncbi:MAG: MBL fold metallo-hydrolase [Thermodesulfobacteriota bacterium]